VEGGLPPTGGALPWLPPPPPPPQALSNPSTVHSITEDNGPCFRKVVATMRMLDD
jgi:hypothetical protein